MRGLATWMLRTILPMLAVILFCLLLAVSLLLFKAHYEKRVKITSALEAHFRGKEIEIISSTEGPINQICYELEVSDPGDASSFYRFVSVHGDEDGGTWMVGSEYKSLENCSAQFFRG